MLENEEKDENTSKKANGKSSIRKTVVSRL